MKVRTSRDCVLESSSMNFIYVIICEKLPNCTIAFPEDKDLEILMHLKSQTEFILPIESSACESKIFRCGEVVARTSVVRDTICVDVESAKKFKPFSIDQIKCDSEKVVLYKLVNSFRTSFSENIWKLGCTHLSTMKILEKSDSKPINVKPYRMSIQDLCELERIVTEWKEANLVKDTNSPYASPALLIIKKTGGKMAVFDYRLLNV